VTPTVRFAARSDVGLIREGNEDSVYAGPRLLAVADGMGGHAAGEVASAVAIATLAPLDDDAPGSDLLDALRRAALTANGQLRQLVADNAALEGMGTTLTAILSAGSRLGMVHVGDSRAYLFRDGELCQITQDHTLVQNLVDQGRLSAEEAGSHPQRSLLTRVLDGSDNVDLDLSVREVRRGDRYLLCTDGLSGVVSPQTMAEALRLPDPKAAVDRLVELALRGGAPDNVTCIVADMVDGNHLDGGDLDGGDPVVAGAAAADQPQGEPAAPDSAAVRAAQASRRDPAPGASAEDTGAAGAAGRGGGGGGGDDAAAGRPGRRRGRRRRLAAGLVVLAVAVVGGGWAIRYYLRTQYFVGTDSRQVMVYRGVSGSVAGIRLASVQQRPGIPITDLPPVVQQRLRQGIPAKDESDAERITARLRAEVSTAPVTDAPTAPTASFPTAPGVPAPPGLPAPPSLPAPTP
jgi:serine/threonine protein phosphatase PrpC